MQGVALLRGQLKIPDGAGLPHFLFQLFGDVLYIAVQEGDHPVDHPRVFLLRAFARAGRQAAADLMIDAGPDGAAERQLFIAGADGKGLAQHLQHVAHGGGPDVRAEILRPVLLHAPRDGDARKGLAPVDAHVGIMLVVLQKDVIVRHVQLDQVAFQRQRFQIGIAQQDIKIVHLRHHGRHLGRMLPRMKIAAHAVLEVHRLAHVNDLPLVLHQVAAGAVGQKRELGFQRFIQHANIPSLRVQYSISGKNGKRQTGGNRTRLKTYKQTESCTRFINSHVPGSRCGKRRSLSQPCHCGLWALQK